MKVIIFLLGLLVSSTVFAAAGSQCPTLLAPPGFYQTIQLKENSKYSCPTFPAPFTETLNFRSKYEGSDKARATLNPESDAAYRQAVEDIRALEKLSVDMAGDYMRGEGAARDCVLDLLYSWATAGALTVDTEENNHIGEAVRKWALAAAGAAYLEIVQLQADLPPLDPKKRKVVERWFDDLTVPIMEYYSGRKPDDINNHDYWAAWAVMLAAINLQDCERFAWAIEKFRQGTAHVDGQGLLANEIRRKSRALNYQNFALQPLVMLAAFAETNQRLRPEDRQALRRLVTAVIKGINDPRMYQALTGEKQEMEGIVTGWSLAWTQPWIFYFDDELLSFLDSVSVKHFSSTRLGGDLAWLFNGSLATAVAGKVQHQPPVAGQW
jgi:poly(beta-D-mannuronate) lyase